MQTNEVVCNHIYKHDNVPKDKQKRTINNYFFSRLIIYSKAINKGATDARAEKGKYIKTMIPLT